MPFVMKNWKYVAIALLTFLCYRLYTENKKLKSSPVQTPKK